MNVTRPIAVLFLAWVALGCAAQRHLERAEAASAGADYAQAVRQYEAALAAKPSLGGDERFTRDLQRARAQQAYAQAGVHRRAHEYDKAVRAYEAALEADATFEPPRAALESLGPEAGQYLFAQAGKQIDEGRLDRAIETLQLAQRYDGSNASIRSRLDDTIALRRQRRIKADGLLARSNQAAADEQWHDALRLAQQALDLMPDDQTIAARIVDVYRRATDSLIEQGRSHLAQGSLDQAAASLNDAMLFAKDKAPVRRVQADVLAARAQAALDAGQPGLAMTHYRAAASLHPDAGSRRALTDQADQARAELLSPFVTDVFVHADDASLSGIVREQMERSAPGLFRYVADGMKVIVADVAYDFDTQRVDTRRSTHSYTIVEQEHNPRLDLLAAQLDRARDDLRSLNRRYHIRCTQCRGEGYFIHPTHKNRQRCSACAGTGRLHYTITDFQLRREERRVEQLERDLASEPATVDRRVPAIWEYQVHTYRVTGTMSATLNVDGARAITIRKTYTDSDTTTDGANPSIGLQDNPLNLPTAGEVRSHVTRTTGIEAAKQAVTLVLERRLVDLREQRKQADGSAADELDLAEKEIRAALEN